jgi:hypothetical protein
VARQLESLDQPIRPPLRGRDGALRAALRRWYDRLAGPAELAHAAEAAW